MGSFFSKKNNSKVVPLDGTVKPASAPSRLEGLDGITHPSLTERRAITPTRDYTGAADASPGPASPGKNTVKRIDVIGKQTDGSSLASALPAAAGGSIPEEGKAWAKVFEERVVKNLFSGNWKDREEGLNSVCRAVTSRSFTKTYNTTDSYQVAMQITGHSLKDKVSPIFHATLELLHNVLSVFGNILPAATLQQGLDSLMVGLMHRCGNLNARIHESALQAIINIASYPSLGTAYVGPYALAPVPKVAKDANASAHMYGRLEVIYSLLSTYCTTVGLGLELTLGFAKQGLEMPDEKVRSCAIKVVVEMYRMRKAAGEELEPERYLGPVKPALLQILQRKFAEASTEVGVSGKGDRLAVATGVKIMVKPLPPLGGSSSFRQGLPPIGGGAASSSAPPSSPLKKSRNGLRPVALSKPSADALSPKSRAAVRPKSKDNPFETSVQCASPWQNGLGVQLRRQDGVLDDDDESLIRYIAGGNDN